MGGFETHAYVSCTPLFGVCYSGVSFYGKDFVARPLKLGLSLLADVACMFYPNTLCSYVDS